MPGQIDRSQFDGEMADPSVRNNLAALTYREVGNQGPDAHRAFAESLFNRAASRNKSLADTISGRDGYFPRASLRGMDGIPQSALSGLNGLIGDVHSTGSNLSNGATGNASGTVGFAGGPQTYASNGERFGREGPDAKWQPRYIGDPPQQMAQSAQGSQPMPRPMGLGGPQGPQGPQGQGEQSEDGGFLGLLNDPVRSPLYSPLTQIGLGLLSNPYDPPGVGLAKGVKSGQDANEYRYKAQRRQQDQVLANSLQGPNAPAWFKSLPPEVQGVFSQLPPDQLAATIAGYVSKRSDLELAGRQQTQQLEIANKAALEQQKAQLKNVMDIAGQSQQGQAPTPQTAPAPAPAPQRFKWSPH